MYIYIYNNFNLLKNKIDLTCSIFDRSLLFFIHGRWPTIFTKLTFAMRGTFFTPYIAFTVTFHTVSFTTPTPPNLGCIKFIDFMSSYTPFSNKFHCVFSLVNMNGIVVTFFANTIGATKSVIVEARAVKFQTMSFRAMAWYY